MKERIGFGPRLGAFAIDVVLVWILAFLSFISVAFIRPYYQNKEIVIAEESLLSAVLKGLIYIKSNKTIFKLLLIFSLGWMVGAAIDIYLII